MVASEKVSDFAAERERLLRKVDRERRARETAETLIETKSLKLFRAREIAEGDRRLMTQAIDALEDGFAIVNSTGQMVLWNGRLTSLTCIQPGADIAGSSLISLVADLNPTKITIEDDPKPIPVLDMETAITDGRSLEIELDDGRVFSLRAGLLTDSGRPVILQDLTVRRFNERRLRETQKQAELGTLAGGIAHEINTPTQYIYDNLQFLLDGLGDVFAAFDDLAIFAGDRADIVSKKHDLAFLRGEMQDAARQGLEGARQIKKIVSAVRLYSHPVSDEKTALDIGEVIQGAVTISRNEWKYVADLSVTVEPDLPPIMAFADGIRQLVLNLVINAAQAIAEHMEGNIGHIRIDVKREGEKIVLTFDDNGPGIPDEISDKVFDPFFTTKPPGKGTGQGLAICRRIVVDNHNGRVSLSRSNLGGARFLVILPITG